ncbi:hypothetical protein PIB30_095351 [Stylosanthes scabra]|uniref:Uncharacterized protein n=1 Tax=Stylosanthes scabra TaxID=79078 RepID=A0ABU6YUJ9_9FABA|nr:hypothetical protein [Stylosanthes scabra]
MIILVFEPERAPARSRQNLKIMLFEFPDRILIRIKQLATLTSPERNVSETSQRNEDVINIKEKSDCGAEAIVQADFFKGQSKAPPIQMELTDDHLATGHHIPLKIREGEPHSQAIVTVEIDSVWSAMVWDTTIEPGSSFGEWFMVLNRLTLLEGLVRQPTKHQFYRAWVTVKPVGSAKSRRPKANPATKMLPRPTVQRNEPVR